MKPTYLRSWIDTYKIHSYESDLTARASTCAILQFMQESAWNHAEHLELGYSHLAPKGLAWVMVRLSLRMEQFPQWGSTITVETFPSGRDKLFAYRDFRINAENGQSLGVGTTTWIVIDMERRRPQRTESYFHIKEWGEFDNSYGGFAPKVEETSQTDFLSSRNVLFSHLDVNGHVNNVKYLEFVLDSFPMEFLRENSPISFDMNFLNEAFCGDVIEIRSQKMAGNYRHSLWRQHDGVELCRLQTSWRKIV